MGVWCSLPNGRRVIPAVMLATLLITAGALITVATDPPQDPAAQGGSLEIGEPPLGGLVQALELSRDAPPGEAVAGPLGAIAQAHGVEVAPLEQCPSLPQALTHHTDRLGLAPTALPALPPMPDDLEEALACLLQAVHEKNIAMDRTFTGLTNTQINALYHAATQQRPLSPALLALIDGRDHTHNLAAAIRAAQAVDHALPLLQQMQQSDQPLPPLDLEPILRFTPQGDTHYTRNYALIVDLEGDDIYENHAGGVFAAVGAGIWDVEEGTGFIGTNVAGQNIVVGGNTQDADAVLSSSLVLDLQGDDTYGVKRQAILKDAQQNCTVEPIIPLVGTIGGGAVGTGMLFDLGGNDNFTGRTLSQGAGHILGVGVLYSGGGNDTFEAIRLAQGSGLLGGIGLLINNQGNNTYHAKSPQGGVWNGDLTFCDDDTRYTQGSAFDRRPGPLLPSIGILADLDGDDHYETHRRSQGFGQGPGMGLLYDARGDDAYIADDMAQGASQGRSVDTHPQAPWGGGLAVLYDRQGDDEYTLTDQNGYGHRGQGYSRGHPSDELPEPTDINAMIQWAVDRNEAIGLHLDTGGSDAYQGADDRQDDALVIDGTLGLFINQDL